MTSYCKFKGYKRNSCHTNERKVPREIQLRHPRTKDMTSDKMKMRGGDVWCTDLRLATDESTGDQVQWMVLLDICLDFRNWKD